MLKEVLIHVLAGLIGAVIMIGLFWIGLDMHLPVAEAEESCNKVATSLQLGCKLPASYESLATIDISEIRDLHRAARASYKDTTFEEESCMISQEELDLFAAIVYAEAGNQDYIGKCLVADVILNRLDRGFGDSITEVIYQPHQFSPVSSGGLQRAFGHVTQECYDAVLSQLQERVDYNVLYFSAGYCANGEFAYQHGDHYFGY